MKVVLVMAISVNGIIASKTNSEDFLSHDNWLEFVKLANEAGCFIWGKNTFEAVMKRNSDYFKDLGGVKKIVISHSDLTPMVGFEFVKSPEEALKTCDSYGFNQVILNGGSMVNSAFARMGLIDEVILYVNPTVLGEGIPVFAPYDFELKLELVNIERVGKEIVELRYRVKK